MKTSSNLENLADMHFTTKSKQYENLMNIHTYIQQRPQCTAHGKENAHAYGNHNVYLLLQRNQPFSIVTLV